MDGGVVGGYAGRRTRGYIDCREPKDPRECGGEQRGLAIRGSKYGAPLPTPANAPYVLAREGDQRMREQRRCLDAPTTPRRRRRRAAVRSVVATASKQRRRAAAAHNVRYTVPSALPRPHLNAPYSAMRTFLFLFPSLSLFIFLFPLSSICINPLCTQCLVHSYLGIHEGSDSLLYNHLIRLETKYIRAYIDTAISATVGDSPGLWEEKGGETGQRAAGRSVPETNSRPRVDTNY